MKENELANAVKDLSESLKWREKYFDALKGEEIATRIMTNQIETLGQALESATDVLKIEEIKITGIMNEMQKVSQENFELKKLLEASENIRIDNENLNMLYLTVKTEVEEFASQNTDLETKIKAMEETNKALETANLNYLFLHSKGVDEIESEREREREQFTERLEVIRR